MITMKFKRPEFSTEFNILTRLIRPTMDENTLQSLSDLIKNPVDWQEFLRLGDRHRVVPLVWRGMGRCRDIDFPENVQETIKRKTDFNRKRALQQTAELIQLSRLFEENGIRAISLKGPILAKQVYGDVGMRHAGDLDLLVDKNNFEKAKLILLQCGYTLGEKYVSIKENEQAVFMELRNHFTFNNPTLKTSVELHWRYLFNNQINILGDSNALINITYVELHKTKINMLPPDSNFLYLVLHGTRHAWFRLKWLCDIAELSNDNINILNNYKEDTIQTQMKRPFLQLSMLLQTLFDMPLPINTTPMNRAVLNLYDYISSRIQSNTHPPFSNFKDIFKEIRYNLLLKRAISYKLKFITTKFIVAGDTWRMKPLSSKYFPIFIIFKPFYVFTKLYRAITNKKHSDKNK